MVLEKTFLIRGSANISKQTRKEGRKWTVYETSAQKDIGMRVRAGKLRTLTTAFYLVPVLSAPVVQALLGLESTKTVSV